MQNIKIDSIQNCYFIMNNVRFHKMKLIKDFVIDYWHQILYFPAFLNPIENVFPKYKNYVRKERFNDENELFQKINYTKRLWWILDKDVTLEDLKMKKLYILNLCKY